MDINKKMLYRYVVNFRFLVDKESFRNGFGADPLSMGILDLIKFIGLLTTRIC